MENFLSKQELLQREKELGADRVILNKIIGLVSWKFHSFLSPKENLELQKLNRVCINNGLVDSIGTVCENLVVRNMMGDGMDYTKDYKINRDVDNDRKTHIIYGFGALDGGNNVPAKLHVKINDLEKEFFSLGNEYFHSIDPFIVLNRKDTAEFSFGGIDSKRKSKVKMKIYGMTCEALGAHVSG